MNKERVVPKVETPQGGFTLEDAKGNGLNLFNPLRSCFGASDYQFVGGWMPEDARLCHGIGVANLAGEEGTLISHAWVEFTDGDGTRVAIDSTWGTISPAEEYREDFEVRHCVEYSKEQYLKLKADTNSLGPWDEQVRATLIENNKNYEKNKVI